MNKAQALKKTKKVISECLADLDTTDEELDYLEDLQEYVEREHQAAADEADDEQEDEGDYDEDEEYEEEDDDEDLELEDDYDEEEGQEKE